MVEKPSGIYKNLENHLPENVIHYCFDLWDKFKFEFKITNRRSSKLGDYRYKGADNSHTITINNDLNKYAFLVTYLHEVAHLITYSEYRSKVYPHGKEWKNNFRKILNPVLNELVFPPDILNHLRNYMADPKASSCSDQKLSKALAAYDLPGSYVHLSEVPIGKSFRFNRKIYQMETSKRTRIICKEVTTGKKYLISAIAKVELLT
ncbi:SprT-like domain-containing protein [soil metagenome]